MPLWAWLLVAIAVLLAAMWILDQRARRRRAQLNDPSAMARGVTGPQANPEAHRGAMTADRFLPPSGGGTF